MSELLKNLGKAIEKKKRLKMFIDGKFIDTYHFEKKVYKGECLGYFELEDLLEIIKANNSPITFEVIE